MKSGRTVIFDKGYKVNGLIKYGFVCKGQVFASPCHQRSGHSRWWQRSSHLTTDNYSFYKPTFFPFLPPLVMYPLLSASSLLNSALISLSPCNTILLIISHLYFAKRKQKVSVKSTEMFDQIIFETLIGMENESSFCLNLIKSESIYKIFV